MSKDLLAEPVLANATCVWVSLEASWIPLSSPELPDPGIGNCPWVLCREASLLDY